METFQNKKLLINKLKYHFLKGRKTMGLRIGSNLQLITKK